MVYHHEQYKNDCNSNHHKDHQLEREGEGGRERGREGGRGREGVKMEEDEWKK